MIQWLKEDGFVLVLCLCFGVGTVAILIWVIASIMQVMVKAGAL